MRRGVMVLLSVWSALIVIIPAPEPARAIPAFARKYGLRCTACHEAWPRLNDFGEAFRDNGYQTLLGKDDPVTTSPGYWPISIRLTPHYESVATTNQPTDQGTRTLRTGGFAGIGIDLITGGTLFNNTSFLVEPSGFAPDGAVTLESAWVRFDNLLGSSWLNIKVGLHEMDLPASSHRPWNLTDTGYLIYGFHAAGSRSVADIGENQRGIEYMGHDRGSVNRVALSVFNVEGSPGSRNAFDTPGFYAHATHEWQFDKSTISEAKLGVFGAYTTWPTTFLTSGGEPIPGAGGDLEPSTKYGVEGQVWLGPSAAPFHATLVFAHGEDARALIPDATRSGAYNGGFLEIGYSLNLKTLLFGRYDVCRNARQGVASNARSLGDQDASTLGVRQTISFTNRAEAALHVEYSTVRTKGVAVNGLDSRTSTYFAGVDFAY